MSPRHAVPSPLSSYYPPRAHERMIPRRLSWILDRMTFWVRRHLGGFPTLSSALDVPVEQWLLALLIPGYAYALLGRRRLAAGLAMGWGAALLVFLIGLGHPWVTGWALGALASAHTSGLGFLLLREREQQREPESLNLRERIGIPLGLWIAASALVYWPASGWFERHVAYPVFVGERTIIMNAWTPPKELRPGQIVAFQLDPFAASSVRVGGGITVGTYLGGPGQRVEFGAADVRINGHSFARLEAMPDAGGITIAPHQHLIWPVLNEVYRRVGQDMIDQAYLQAAQVPELNLIGRPFKRWFFYRQDAL